MTLIVPQMRRTYTSPARDDAKAHTRARIVSAVVRVVLDDGIHAFTMENVASKARVSLRTVYRHFTTRDLLVEGLSESLDHITGTQGLFPESKSVEGCIALIAPVFEQFGHVRDALCASVIASIALPYRRKGKEQRWQELHDILTATYPYLASDDLEQAIAVIGSLSSSHTWFQLTAERNLTDRRAGQAVTWAIRTLFADLELQNAAAARV
jgi:AcrR family transcriptional regulator